MKKQELQKRSKRTWIKAIKKNILMIHVIQEMTLNGAKWKKMIHVAGLESLA